MAWHQYKKIDILTTFVDSSNIGTLNSNKICLDNVLIHKLPLFQPFIPNLHTNSCYEIYAA